MLFIASSHHRFLHPHATHCKISSLRKRDFRHSEAKSACFNISIFVVKMLFFFHQNETKLHENDANFQVIKLWEKYTVSNCFPIRFVFRQRRDQQEAFFGGIFPQKPKPPHRSQGAFRGEGAQSQAADSLSVVMAVGKYPLTSFKVLFTRSLSSWILMNGR